MKIYDYSGAVVDVPIPDGRTATKVRVLVLSGDETGTVTLDDGREVHFDASSIRCTDYFDGECAVEGDALERWMNFAPRKSDTPAYARMSEFGGWMC